MNYDTDIVIFFWGGGGGGGGGGEGGAYWRSALSREERLFRKSYFLKGRSLESGLIGEWALIRSFTIINPSIPFTGINIFQNAFGLLFD